MRKKKTDLGSKTLVVGCACISLMLLLSIMAYLLKTGLPTINMHLMTADYYANSVNAEVISPNSTFPDRDIENYVARFGIAFKDDINTHNEKTIVVSYIDPQSPLYVLSSTVAGEEGREVRMEEGAVLENMYIVNRDGSKIFLSKGRMQTAGHLAELLNNEATSVSAVSFSNKGGGIRGSLWVTLYLIVIALLFSLPIGIASAIYLHEYASNNKWNAFVRQGIETLNGVPSIIFGLMGVSVLFPITQAFGANSTSVLLGGLTMAVILLPTIIRSTEEALMVVPNELREGSLAIGATKSQTIFKVVLPCAINGILTGVLLGIGRVIGESAALIYTTSTIINDHPTLLKQGTSLSLMIWAIMSGEQPNYELASAVSLIILAMVFTLNTIVKIIMMRLKKRFA